MANEQTINTARALIDMFDRRDVSIWENALADDFVADYPGAHVLNKDAAKMYNLSFLNASDDIRFDVQHIIVNDNTVVFQASVSGTMHHDLVTPNGIIPATGKPDTTVPVPFVLIAQVRDGKVVREQTVWNQLEVFMLWGILPVPA